MQIRLASASPIRARLLTAAAVDHIVDPARVDEDALRAAAAADALSPRDTSDMLAEAKARKIAAKHPDAAVLGCDQILALDTAIFEKPADRAAAAETLIQLQGKTHRLYSAAVIYLDNAPIWRAVGEARMTMHTLTPEQIDAYLDHTWPDVADAVGAYRAEGYGARLFSHISGDWHSVLGLPLLQVLNFLRLRGWLQ